LSQSRIQSLDSIFSSFLRWFHIPSALRSFKWSLSFVHLHGLEGFFLYWIQNEKRIRNAQERILKIMWKNVIKNTFANKPSFNFFNMFFSFEQHRNLFCLEIRSFFDTFHHKMSLNKTIMLINWFISITLNNFIKIIIWCDIVLFLK